MDERFQKERVPSTKAVAARICRALVPLKKLRDESFASEGPDETIVIRDPELVGQIIGELTEALADLSGAPAERDGFHRDHLWDVVDKHLPQLATEASAAELLDRLKSAH